MKYRRKNKKNTAGFTLAELLIAVAILVILLGLGIPALLKLQKELRQKELDSKAETIYQAVQNKMTKLRTAGTTAIYTYDGGSNCVYISAAESDDSDTSIPEDERIKAGDLCYITSDQLEVAGSAPAAIMTEDTVDAELRDAHWVIEYNPDNAVVYGVFYSESLANCAEEYRADDGEKYDFSMRYRDDRLEDGARVGYYGGGSSGSGRVTNMQPKVEITNEEKLVADFSCTLPTGISTYPVFKIELSDTEGHTYTKYYGYWACDADYSEKIRQAAAADGADLDMSANSMQREGRTFLLTLTMDDLSKASTRFDALYGSGSGNKIQLTAGTDLKVKVTALCPGNHKITSTLFDEKTTNSLFADSSRTGEDGQITAVIAYGRHLQNLDADSGVTAQVTSAEQVSNITMTDADRQTGTKDWYETYSGGYYNGLLDEQGQLIGKTTKDTEGRPNFAPIVNANLLSYDGKPAQIGGVENTTQFRIVNLTERVEAGADGSSTAGLFGLLSSGQTLKNIVLTGTEITADGAGAAAGTLVGKVTCSNAGDTVFIENCQTFLTSTDLSGKNNQDIRVKAAGAAGGLVGAVEKGTVTIQNSAASTVVGDAVFAADSGEVTEYRTKSVGGLVGQVGENAAVNISRSYADNYLVGKTAGGLVGQSTGKISLSSVYGAGFATFDTEGAGLVCGSADLKNSYTVLSKLHVNEAPYYSTVTSGATEGKVYYFVYSTDSAKDLGEEINDFTIDQLSEALGGDFKTDTSDSTPYNLMGQSLTKYVYPVLSSVTHYGDWDASFEEGTLVYYEAYSDGTYGFYGANVDSTLSNSADLTVTGDGYGLVYLSNGGNLPNSLTVTMTDGEEEIARETISINSGNYYSVTGKDGKGYRIYPLSKETVNADHAATGYWLKLKVEPDSGTNAAFYYFNPQFAKTVVPLTDSSAAAPALTEDSEISVRTARHIYMMSLWYDTYGDITKPCTYAQERNIDYSTYNWGNYSTRTDDTSKQKPISGNDTGEEATAFRATYNGQCNWITNVSFVAEEESYVGFIGKNQGTIKNVVLRASYTAGAPDNYYVGRSGDIQSNQSVYVGILTGANEAVEGEDKSGRISNCAVSGYYVSGSDGTLHAYKNSYLYAGGLVGYNSGTVSNSSADIPEIKLSATFANADMGGFVGDNSGTVSNSYALGHLEVVYARGGSVQVAGFAGENSSLLRNCYCATAITAAGETTTAYGFAPNGGSVISCEYLNNGAYSYIGKVYPFSYEGGAGSEKNYETMEVSVDSVKAAVYSYDFNNTETSEGRYPFRAVVTNSKGQRVHYGDWLEETQLGTVGFFYWEHEVNGQNNGYHLTYLGIQTKEDGTTSTIGASTLCNSHDDGGVISEYGYGYFQSTDNPAEVGIISSDSIGGLNAANINQEASENLQKQLSNYTFVAYTTSSDTGNAADDSHGIYLNTTNPTQIQGSVTLTGGYTFTFTPFFANAMQYAGQNIIITDNAGDQTSYIETAGSQYNPYEIRSLTQLQYLNWNNATKTATAYLHYDATAANHWYTTKTAYDSKQYAQASNAKAFPYLGYAYPTSSTANAQDHAANYYFSQTHDLEPADEEVSEFTPIGSAYDSIQVNGNNSTALYVVYFNGAYNGNSYQIKNVNISSPGQAVGLFGAAMGCRIEGLIMYSDQDNVVEVAEKGSGWYNSGCVVGMGLTGGTMISKMENCGITNCAVAGYTLRDSRGSGTNDEHCGYGGCNEGGFAGLCNINISNCTSVVDIEINAQYSMNSRNIRVGGLVGNYHGTTLKNCYAGGSVTKSTYNNTNMSACGLCLVGFVRVAGNMNSLFGTLNTNPTIQNCYSYTDLSTIDVSKNCIASLCPVASNGNVENSSTSVGSVKNCYYYEPKATTYKNRTLDINKATTKNTGTATTDVSGCAMSITYGQLAGTDDLTTGSYKNKKIDYALNAGGTSDAYQWVTVTEGKSARIDGKYSFPGNAKYLEGQNYPFPTVLQQPDLIFGGQVNVHYGAWPEEGVYWEEGRTSMDIFADMQEDVAYEEYSGDYAVKEFYLHLNGQDVTPALGDFSADEKIARVVSVERDSEDPDVYIVSVLALKKGMTDITFRNENANEAKFTLEVTANLAVEADPEKLELRENETDTVTLLAYAKKDESKSYATDENAKWTLTPDVKNLLTISQSKTEANVWSVTREGYGKVTLTAAFTYDYHGVKLTGRTYVEIGQPDSVGLSDGKSYNTAYFDEDKEEITGENASYASNPPTLDEGDFFLFLDARTEHFLDEQGMRVTGIYVNGQLAVASSEDAEDQTDAAVEYVTEEGYHVELMESSSVDENYEYLPGNIYRLVTEGSGEPQENVLLAIDLSDDTSIYHLQLTLAEVETVVDDESISPAEVSPALTLMDGEQVILDAAEGLGNGDVQALPTDLYTKPTGADGWELDGWYYVAEDGREFRILDGEGRVTGFVCPGITTDDGAYLLFAEDITLQARWVQTDSTDAQNEEEETIYDEVTIAGTDAAEDYGAAGSDAEVSVSALP